LEAVVLAEEILEAVFLQIEEIPEAVFLQIDPTQLIQIKRCSLEVITKI